MGVEFEIEKEVMITLKMSVEHAAFLRGVMQNPLGVEQAASFEQKARCDLFHACKDAIEQS